MCLKKNINIASFNAENFYLLLDSAYCREELDALSDEAYMSMNHSVFNPNKSREKIHQIANIILEHDFDIVGLCEIGGLETLNNFNRLYLHNAYDCYLHQENSRRGIFVGALVKKGKFTGVVAENLPGPFARNLLRLTLTGGGRTLTVYVVHLKSQLGDDFGISQRLAEIQFLVRTVERRRCVVMGDFNGIAVRGSAQFEYEPFLELPFRDVLEDRRIPLSERFTHYYFSPVPSFTQLDYIFCSRDITVKAAGVVRGIIPLNSEQRRRLPSDHLFIHALLRV